MVNFCSRKNILSFHFLFFLFYLFSLLLSGSQISAEFFGFLEKCSAPYFRCYHRFNLTAEKGFKRIAVTSPSLFSSQSISNSTELKNRDLLAASPANSIIVQTATLPNEVVAQQDSMTAFSTLLTLQNTTSGSGARGDYS
jgi:hypothetical protein